MGRFYKALFGIVAFVVALAASATAARAEDLRWINENNAGNYAYGARQFDEAEKHFTAALKIAEESGAPDEHLIKSLETLIELYKSRCKWAQAEPLCRRYVRAIERLRGPKSLTIAEKLDDLASLDSLMAKFSDADSAYQRSLAIREKALGPDHYDVARSLSNLAGVYLDEAATRRNSAKCSLAEPLLKRALAIDEKSFGADHPTVALALFELGRACHEQQKYDQAEPLYKRSLAISEKPGGTNSSLVIKNLYQLGRMYVAQRK